MAKQTRRTNPGDAANAFVRVILSDAGAMLGGLKEHEWRKTLEWFDGRCAYTGRSLADGETERDHAIPMNRTQCGLHLYGNVVPATQEANRRKAGTHYREFIEDRDRLERIDAFLRASMYWERVSAFGNLQTYCEAQYRAIDALCRVNRQYLLSLLPPAPETDEKPETNRSETPPKLHGGAGVLPIVLDPSPETAFRKALLRQQHAWIVEVHQDGRQTVRRWNAANMSESSGIHRESAKSAPISEGDMGTAGAQVVDRLDPATGHHVKTFNNDLPCRPGTLEGDGVGRRRDGGGRPRRRGARALPAPPPLRTTRRYRLRAVRDRERTVRGHRWDSRSSESGAKRCSWCGAACSEPERGGSSERGVRGVASEVRAIDPPLNATPAQPQAAVAWTVSESDERSTHPTPKLRRRRTDAMEANAYSPTLERASVGSRRQT